MSITRFSSLNDINGLGLDALKANVPALFAKEPSRRMSERYTFVNSLSLVEEIMKAGYIVTAAQQRATRSGGRDPRFTRHMLRFRDPRIKPSKVGDVLPEVQMVNSHDGQSRFLFTSGLFRLACTNGLLVPMNGDSAGIVQTHIGDLDEIMTRIRVVMDKAVDSIKVVDRMTKKKLSDAQQLSFAKQAVEIVYDKDSPIDPKLLLNVRRDIDKEPTVWNVFNRVQENIVRGGLDIVRGDRTFHTRGITHIGRTSQVNLALWVLAEKFAKPVMKKAA